MTPEIRIWRYELPLVATVSLSPGVEMSVREGLLLELVEGGRSFWGEAAPLPGFSPESLDEARRDLEKMVRRIARAGDSWRSVAEAVASADASPSANFALASVLNSSVLESPPAANASIPLCGLLSGVRDEILADAVRLRDRGFEAAKLKVGRGSVADDAALVQDVRDVLGEGASLRLDANRAWGFDEAEEFARLVSGVGIEFVEEPLEDPARLREFSRKTNLPVALDESLSGATGRFDAAAHEYAEAFVLKPTVVGASRAMSLAEAARDFGAKVVVSSAYESGVGTLALLRLASSVGDAPAGLDTYSRLADDVLSPRLDLSEPWVDMEDLFEAERSVEYEKLERVS